MNMLENKKAWLLALFVLLASQAAFSAVPDNNILDGIIERYRTHASSWSSVLVTYTLRLFWLLVVIDFAWNAMVLAMKQAGQADFAEIVSFLVQRVMYIGFFLALIQYSGSWPGAIIESFRTAANAANAASGIPTPGLSPSSIFDIGLRMAVSITDNVSFTAPGDSLALVISSLIVFICFALVAAFLLVALIEMYIALNAGVILLGFGGSSWTNDYAKKYLTYIVSIGVKIFSMQLIIGIGQTFVLEFMGQYEKSNADTLVFIGVSIVLLILTKTIPDTLQGLIAGISVGGGGHALTAAASAAGGAAVGAATGGLAAGAGSAMAAVEASKLAGSQGAKGMGGVALGAIKNLAGAGVADLASRISGVPGSQHGSMGGRMAARMREQRLMSAPPESPSTSGQTMNTGANTGPDRDQSDIDVAFEETAVSEKEVLSASKQDGETK